MACRFSSAFMDAISVYEGKTVTDEPSKGLLFTAPVNTAGGLLWSCNFALRKSAFDELADSTNAFQALTWRTWTSVFACSRRDMPSSSCPMPEYAIRSVMPRQALTASGCMNRLTTSRESTALRWRTPASAFAPSCSAFFKDSVRRHVSRKNGNTRRSFSRNGPVLLPFSLLWAGKYSRFAGADDARRPALRPQT